jgi:hypothetical protein
MFIIDDDTFFSPFVLQRIIAAHSLPDRSYYGGIVVSQQKYTTRRTTATKDNSTLSPATTTVAMSSTNGRMALGGSIVLSHDLVEWIVSSKLNLRRLPRDDLSIASWMNALDGVQPQPLPAPAKSDSELPEAEFIRAPYEYLLVVDVEDEQKYQRYWKLVSNATSSTLQPLKRQK